MQKIRIDFSQQEVQTLLTLTDNQLFRMKFIDSKLPGHTVNREALDAAQAVVKRLRDSLSSAKGLVPAENVPLKEQRINLKRSSAA